MPKVVKIYSVACLLFLLNINSVAAITFPLSDVAIPSLTQDTVVPGDSLPNGGQDSTSTLDSDELKSKIKYTATDSMRFDMHEEKTYLSGDATVDYEDLHLKAERIVVDWNKKEIYAEGGQDSSGRIIGKPEFTQGDQHFKSSTIRYNFESKKGKLSYLVTQEGEGFIHGEAVKKDEYNDFFVRQGIYTTCNQDTPHYSISTRKLKLVNTGTSKKIVTGPAYLTIEGVPTPLLIPFGFFPNSSKRTSGIIFPSFGESAARGFYFQHLGYYFGFNDYFNLALTSDIYTQGSYNLTASSAYAKRYGYRGLVNLSFSKVIVSEKELPDYEETKDFHINWNHAQDSKANPYSSFSASVNAGSSTYYRNNLSSPTNFLNNTFQSSINYSKSFPDKPINLGVSLSHYQNTTNNDIRISFPDVSFGVSRIDFFKRKNAVGAAKWYEKIGASYTMRATNYIETKDSLLFDKQSLKEFKNGIQHAIPISTSLNAFKFISIAPSFNYTSKWYFKTVRYNWNESLKKVDTTEVVKFSDAREWNFGVGLNTRVYGMYQYKKGPITALRHVLTPLLSFNIRPDFSADKYGYYNYVQTDTLGNIKKYSIYEGTVYGGPSAGKSGTIGFALDNNLEMKVRTNSDTGEVIKKIKLFESLRLGSSYNLAADSMNLSVISLSARTILLNKLDMNFNSTFNPYNYDATGRFIDEYLVKENGKLATLTSANLSLGWSLHTVEKKLPQNLTVEQLDYFYNNPDAYVDFNIPFNIQVNYKYSYTKQPLDPSNVSQTVNVTGDLNITPKWKIGFYSWYDFEERDFTNLNLNIYRDLHCWEMRIGWIPFGEQQSYNFQINVKSSVLQDLKFVSRKDIYDR